MVRNVHEIRVSLKGDGDCTTIREALSLAGEYEGGAVCIRIGAGVYTEKVVLTQDRITFEGAGAEETILSWGDYARAVSPDGTEYGTFRTATMMVDADCFTARNMTFRNTAGSGEEIGQALALYVDGDRIFFENCRITGGQDTLFTAPLPPAPLIKNGFKGPKENAPRRMGRHWYKDCLISGDVDFIFGGATAFFEGCEIVSVGKGFVTAASTPENEKYGYVFDRCIFRGECEEGGVYLGRPWRDYARTVIMNSYIGSHIHEEGWHDWDKKSAREKAVYAEYRNSGPGADISRRAEWVRSLTDEEAKAYTREAVLGLKQEWDDRNKDTGTEAAGQRGDGI